MDSELEAIASPVINTAMGIHVHVGPSLLESVFETRCKQLPRVRQLTS
jgi:hypothetical protein